MADRRRRGVRIGTESPASHSSIASNITTANSTTNPTAQRPRQPVNAWANPGRTEQYPVNLVSAETTTEEFTSSVLIIEEPRTYEAQVRPTGLSVPQMTSRNMQNVTVEILSSDDEDN
ncbi:hypothetical protein DVH24_006595 [Malus domestica]|uniref:Uncharacterized protein n=1 Tax=Malus domestica TaxID=3750 RepID=A0A498KCS1_MALDO|nr:hypothetical protein DVH24_006595 [Malus domestica]